MTRHVYEAEAWGVGEVWAHHGVVVHHELAVPPDRWPAGDSGDPAGGAGSPARGRSAKVSHGRDPFVAELCGRFRCHLGGDRVDYAGVPIELGWMTQFQQALAAALRDVPWGEVVSYGELAALAGRPGAARAAGSFCAGNRFALIVPCHRVVAADGIGGDGPGGVALKRRLLALEGVDL